MPINPIKFDLINNAKDSLHHAVKHLTDPEGIQGRDLKVAIRDIAHVIELLLKEKLRRIHPAFIYQDIDKYQSPEATTITTDKAIERIFKFAGIVLGEDSKRTITSCRKIRNAIEHYEFELNPKEAKGVIGRMLSFIFDFSKKYLELDLEGEFRKDDTWKALIEIYEFWEAHAATIEKRLSEENKAIDECPSCGAATFDLSESKCLLCAHYEDQIECDRCHNLVWESDTQTFEGIEGDEDSGAYHYSYTICNSCCEAEAMADMAADALRDELRGKQLP